jgi:gamma-glutamyltranspeptidase/glutathione hydrolase
VPAALDAVLTLLDRFGTMSFAQVVAPTLALLARRRQQWQRDFARTLNRLVEAERAARGDRRSGLRAVGDCFYRGPIARQLDEWSRQAGGLIRFEDMATHVTRIEDAVSAEYRGHVVHKCGPWTQGPYLLQTLQLLEGFDLAAMGHLSPDSIHVCAEAMKLALADRDVYYADPLFEDVPIDELLSPRYADARRKLIDMAAASHEQRPGDPRAFAPRLAEAEARVGLGGPANDTTTCLTADASGNMLAATPSGWGGVVAGRTGVVLGTRLQSFNTWPGHPNCIAPGKRPRITLTPTIVTRDGKPVLAVSVAGGDGQDQAALQMVIDAIDFGLDPSQSVTAARFGTNHLLGSFRQTPPDLGSLTVYESLGPETIDALRARGHRVTIDRPPLWHPTVLGVTRRGRGFAFHGAGDPKAGRHAMGL